jgi:hypothetical protein
VIRGYAETLDGPYGALLSERQRWPIASAPTTVIEDYLDVSPIDLGRMKYVFGSVI